MKARIKQLGYCVDDKLRSLCGELTPDKRLMIVLVTLLIGVIVNLYFSFSAIYNMGQNSAKKEFMEVEHIKQIELEKKSNNQNNEMYEYND